LVSGGCPEGNNDREETTRPGSSRRWKTSLKVLDGKLTIISERIRSLESAAADSKVVRGYTHNYYRYPARFAPSFVREAIESFSRPGETILDPFVGGGTSVVESLAQGRKFVGFDLNPIAIFVSRVKSTPLSEKKLERAKAYAKELFNGRVEVRGASCTPEAEPDFVNTPWWMRHTISAVRESLLEIEDVDLRAFLQCALLSTSQWALDCRSVVPRSAEFFRILYRTVVKMTEEMNLYCDVLRSAFGDQLRVVNQSRRIILRSAAHAHLDKRVPREWLPAKLVITSPPYPGVHVLYHRWQVQGRRETAAPFAILASKDGHGPSHYTLGGRHEAGLRRFFDNLIACFRSISYLLDEQSVVVQLVSVANYETQLPGILTAMDRAGFEECTDEAGEKGSLPRFWRSVPNRKWYASGKEHLTSAKELLLIHRLKKDRKTTESSRE
jgi:hypothetical protein